VASWPGRVLISQEQLCRAGPEQVARAVDSLAPAEITIIVTARDLARQLTSHWQQQLKGHFMGTLADMIQVAVEHQPNEDDFWGHQDLQAIIDRWLGGVPPDRLVVVTLPPAGTPPEVLWSRFCQACDLDPDGFDLQVERPNESLGAVQAELLRRVKLELGPRIEAPGAFAVIRRVLANDLLARQPNQEAFGLPPEAHAWATRTGHEWVAALSAWAVRVVGDLGELVPPAWQRQPDPQTVADEAIARSAVTAIADLLSEWQSRARARPPRPGAGTGGARRREASAG
jgi:hypothetical protein